MSIGYSGANLPGAGRYRYFIKLFTNYSAIPELFDWDIVQNVPVNCVAGSICLNSSLGNEYVGNPTATIDLKKPTLSTLALKSIVTSAKSLFGGSSSDEKT